MMHWIRFLVLISVVASAACDGASTSPSESASVSQLPPDDVIYGLHHVITKDGVRNSVLKSDTAYVEEAGQRFDLRGVHLQFYSETGQETGTLTSKTGEYDSRNGSMIARGDVVLVTRGAEGERRLETEELHYDIKADQLSSERPFVLTENGQVSRGTSFRSDAQGTNWTAKGLQSEGVEAGSSDLTF